jgi:flagellar biosynthetic protein FliR
MPADFRNTIPMSAATLLPWAFSVMLLTVRLTMAVALSPALSSYGVPGMVRFALTVALALLTFAHRSAVPAAAGWLATPGAMIVPVLAEVFIGALLGLGVHVLLAALALAGRLMDVQIGFAIGSVFDPVTRTSSNVLGSLVSLLGVTIFVISNAHLRLAELVAGSIDLLPLGQMPALNDPMQPLLAAGSMFALGLAFAGPVALALLLTDVAIAVTSRNMPQLNVLVLAIPVKVIVGYLVLAVALTGWAPLMQQALAQAVRVLGTR